MTLALVIDDNRQTADALTSMLRLYSIEARAVYNPSSALSILEEAIPQIIFLDINMPGVNGFDVLSFLKREPRLEKVPVVIVTSDDQPETAKRALRGGAKSVVYKPVMPEMLEEALKQTGIWK
jgi:CheY-like chemotaxis protein